MKFLLVKGPVEIAGPRISRASVRAGSGADAAAHTSAAERGSEESVLTTQFARGGDGSRLRKLNRRLRGVINDASEDSTSS